MPKTTISLCKNNMRMTADGTVCSTRCMHGQPYRFQVLMLLRALTLDFWWVGGRGGLVGGGGVVCGGGGVGGGGGGGWCARNWVSLLAWGDRGVKSSWKKKLSEAEDAQRGGRKGGGSICTHMGWRQTYIQGAWRVV